MVAFMEKQTKEHITDTSMEVKYLKGVGEARARLLARLGIKTVLDLMEHFPREYLSRRIEPALTDMKPGDRVAFTALISWVDSRTTRNGKTLLNVGISDSITTVVCSWFSPPKGLAEQFKPGNTLWVNGMLSEYNGQLQMMHPDFEQVEEGAEEGFWHEREVLPVYPLTSTLTQKTLRRLVLLAFASFADKISENLPPEIMEQHGFPARRVALQKMHFTLAPQDIPALRRRFVYEDFFYSQLLWARHRHLHGERLEGITFENRRDLTTRLRQKLPWELTGAQKRVIREIFADMTSPKQMSRLVQGDVGSGKTIVTVFAMLLAVENGYQAALMAPTEILADQHYTNIRTLLEELDVKVCVLKGGSYKGKSALLEDIAEGRHDIIIGTHALIQGATRFHRLGFVAVDEQHRFGVQQRASLARKDEHPDLLYLSATPIPRSLSMTVYGDLEVSRIDEMPPNRKPILTLVRSVQKMDLVYSEVAEELAKGHQVYVVCPLIEESDKVDLLDAQRLHAHLSTKVFRRHKCELLHGRMPARQKDDIMLRFKQGEIKVLVSTTVIEVGVDVPNATVMIVEHAERFGLAQLHQLRGRVGRGADRSRCYLIEHFPLGAVARERLYTMARTTDGFEIAEKDLELRGPGEVFGNEQSGMPDFRFANIMRDQDVLATARADAFRIIASDPDLELEQNMLLKEVYTSSYAAREKLVLY